MSPDSSHFLAPGKIIVAGAGMAGLAFVIALRKQWTSSSAMPEVVIYDRDTRKVGVGREGYSLSLSEDGLVALRDLGLLEPTLDRAILGLDSVAKFKLWARDWSEIFMTMRQKPREGLPSSGIRIARKDLRSILVEAGEATGTIAWGVSCTSAERLENGRIRVQLSGQAGSKETSAECDLLIAADGAHSKIRAGLRPADTLEYAGAVQLGGSAKFPNG